MSSPWPAPTPAPTRPPSPTKRRRTMHPRQIIADLPQVSQAMTDCQLNSGNNVFSCFPTANTTILQHEWATFVWNSRRPDLTQTNLVDIFLFRADSRQQILSFINHTNPSEQAGSVSAQVNDSWFGEQGLEFTGKRTPFPFYWVIIRSDKTLDGNQVPQPIFTAVQTAVLDSVAAASSSSAAAAASSSSIAAAAAASSSSAAAASLSSFSASLSSHSATANNPTSTGPAGAVQRASSGSSFPRWAIAVIVVLGFLAIAATCILVFLILRRMRRAREQRESRSSMGSASPMINRDAGGADGQQHPEMTQRYDGAGSPLLPPPGVIGGGTSTMHDGASTNSDSGGPFSGADAALMADVFRKMLRKPDFAEGPVVEEGGQAGGMHELREGDEDEDGDEEGGIGGSGLRSADAAASSSNIVLSRELAEEGRDIRSVSSSRGVKVERQDER